MSEGDGMAEVTEGDREKAMRAVGYHEDWAYEDLEREFSASQKNIVDRVAAALAEEREKARVPFLALAQELASVATYHHATVAGDAYADAADRIIAILDGTYR